MADIDFRARQYEFAAHMRDPDNQPAPAEIENRRMQIYRDLFFNNVVTFLRGQFPILSAILGDERWAMLVRDWYREHRSRSPLLIGYDRPGSSRVPLSQVPVVEELSAKVQASPSRSK